MRDQGAQVTFVADEADAIELEVLAGEKFLFFPETRDPSTRNCCSNTERSLLPGGHSTGADLMERFRVKTDP